MSDAVTRFETIEATYIDANYNHDSDLALAPNDAERAKIRTNLQSARTAYFTAVVAVLSKADPSVDAAHAAAVAANQSVKRAREQAEAFPELLKKLNTATTASTQLLKLAKTFPA